MYKLRLVFWHNILSDHQSALVKVLAEYPDVTVYFAYENSKQRGWSVPDFGKATVLDVREPSNYAMLTAMTTPQDIHILSGYFSYPISWQAFHTLRCTPAYLCILSEAFDFRGAIGWLRLQRARLQTLIWGKNIDAVLAMGQLGTSFYRAVAFPAHKVYEFSYFVEVPACKTMLQMPENQDQNCFQILFVGQLIHRKGLDLLLQALSQCNISLDRIQCNVIGTGTLRSSLEALVNQLGLGDRVSFLGGQPNPTTLTYMEQADLLVLPSRWDGWGAVINEALLTGTPVLCSDKCGASNLVTASGYGRVFKSEIVKDLADQLQAQFHQGKVTPPQRKHLKNWARCLESSKAAKYLLEIVSTFQCDPPNIPTLPPWYL